MEKSIFVTDWSISMGVTALMRIVPSDEFQVEGNRFYYKTSLWKNFSSYLFDYMITKYSRAVKKEEYMLRYFDMIKKNIGGTTSKEKENARSASEWLLATVKDSLHKVQKYFIDEQATIKELITSTKQQLAVMNLEDLEETIAKVITLLKQPEVDEKLTLNFVKAIILKPSVGQVSFLNSSKSSFSRKDQQDIFYFDFIKPLIVEDTMRDLLAANHQDSLNKLLNNSDTPISIDWQNQVTKKHEPLDRWFARYSECALLNDEWGSIPFEEKLFMPLGSTSLNDRWDGKPENMQHISTLARLLLFLTPFGCAMYKKKTTIHDHTVFSFLYLEGQCQETLERNNRFYEKIVEKNQFVVALRSTYDSESYVMEEKRRTTVIIEWFTENKTKKTLLEKRVISEKFLKYIVAEDLVAKIYPFDFRERFVHQCLREQDSKYVIMEEIYRQLEARTIKRNTFSLKQTLFIRELLLGEVNEVGQLTLTDRMYTQGYELRQNVLKRENNKVSQSLYQVPKEKKLDSFLYRILNVAKNGNRVQFFDLILRLNLFAGKQMNEELTSLLDRNEVSDAQFATIALAFIAGLTSVKTNEGDVEIGENN